MLSVSIIKEMNFLFTLGFMRASKFNAPLESKFINIFPLDVFSSQREFRGRQLAF